MMGGDRQEMLREHHAKMLWAPAGNILLGVWLLTSPVTFGYRSLALTWSDLISGALLIVLGALSLDPRRIWAPWAVSFVGIWLLFAPIVFWAPSAAAFLNATLVGTLVIAFAILVPGMPGMTLIMQPGPERPPGWSYNPSSWYQRAPVIALGFVGLFISRYLAAYQLGYIDRAWDPFFGGGTERILTSDVSRAWPVSDAGLGTAVYTLEALMGFMGGTSRWRTMPWMVLLFGILVVPLGIVSITLVILQPVMVGTWCTLCLVTALAMLVMIPLTLDEVVAMIQFMVVSVRDNGSPFWGTFLKGGTIEGGGEDGRSPRFGPPSAAMAPPMVWGVTVPWTLLVSTAAGVWLMGAPVVFDATGRAADSDFLVGPLIAVVAVIAMAEVVRPVRFVNVLFGLWLVAAPWLLAGATTGLKVNDVVAGLALIALSLPRGSVRERYGGWQRYLAWSPASR